MTNRRRILRIFLWLSSLAALAGLAVLGGLVWLRNREVTLPEPGGPYLVGRVAYNWTDASRTDPLENDPARPRKLNVWIWYPAARPAAGTTPAPYLPPAWIAARERLAGPGALFMQNLARVRGHSTEAPPLAEDKAAFPVILMQPGLGPILPDYTSLCEALASQGYIVAGSTPTGSAGVVVFNDGEAANQTSQGNVPDTASLAETQRILGELIQVWAADDRFVLDQLERLNAAGPTGRFTGRLELRSVGVMGHSFGGATAAEFCSQDGRCGAGIDLDGYPYGDVIQKGLRKPFLFIWSEPTDPNNPAWQRAIRDTGAIFRQLPAGSMQVTIRGAQHFNFTDNAVEFQPLLRLLGDLGPIDGAYGLHITTTYIEAFFDSTLRGQASAVLQAATPLFPEVQVEKR